jgi:CubicO group peptidase (beta-lactamase class C family)
MPPVSVDDFLRSEIALGSFPGCSYALGTLAALERENGLGQAVAVPLRIPATTATIYDCASITKPLVTGTLVLQAVAEEKLSLDERYRGHRIRDLLTHSSGLRAWLPLYAFDDPLKAIEELGPEYPPGTRTVYSDLNFALLYFRLRELFGDYIAAARERIFEPLGLRDSLFNPPALLKPRIAATEWGQLFERGMCATRSIAFTGFREGLMWGEPNDGNAFHAGGTLGNAGLFSTARDVFRIAQGFARGELVPPELVKEATRPHIGDRGLGWQIGGPGLSPQSFGHSGFTGTSVWVDGERIYVLLTNRVHPSAAPIAMQRIRGEFHSRSAVAVPPPF